MDNTARIRELLEQIHDTEQRLDGLRAKLARLVAEELGRPEMSLRSHKKIGTCYSVRLK
jgi:hypothetical protein